LQRIVSSLVGAPILILIVYLGGTSSFFLVAAVATGLGCLELKGMFEKAGRPFSSRLGLPFSLFLLFSFYWERVEFVPFLLLLLLLGLLVFTSDQKTGPARAFEAAANTFLGVGYVALCLGCLVLVRGLDAHGFLVFFVLAATWSGDTLAYYTGSWLGKRPLAPRISPKKTIEGALGGLAGSLTGGAAVKFFLLPGMPLSHALILSLLCGVFGQMGDLAESMIKRSLGAKDSGTILPGHGGLLDRMDGVFFSAPVFYFYYTLVLL